MVGPPPGSFRISAGDGLKGEITDVEALIGETVVRLRTPGFSRVDLPQPEEPTATFLVLGITPAPVPLTRFSTAIAVINGSPSCVSSRGCWTKSTDTLSGGQQQRVAIARCADHPTGRQPIPCFALDVRTNLKDL
ncbi:hypothetical protein ABT009_32700 [Streptomyces sp. NPDC002896]|uniref:hypothetical protein n=1 Tax=Streptomyces sp. NPDC002896 TaxID=3154438 RepID=UPI00331AC9C5